MESSDFLPEKVEKLMILINGIDESTIENTALENAMSTVLKDLGLDLTFLPSDIKEGLDRVCDILGIEGLTDFDFSTLEIHMQHKELEARKKTRAESEFKVYYEEAFQKYKRMQEKLESVKICVNSLARKSYTVGENYKNNDSERLLTLTKLKTYKDKVAVIEKQLQDLQIRDLHHNEIMKESSICMQRLGELAELNKYLSHYGDLPPNLLQAKAMLECKKRELEKLDHMVMERLT